MPIPDFQTIMLPLLEMFKDGEAKTTTQMYADLADFFGLTELERTERLPSGHQTRYVGVTTEDSYVVKKIDSDYFSEE